MSRYGSFAESPGIRGGNEMSRLASLLSSTEASGFAVGETPRHHHQPRQNLVARHSNPHLLCGLSAHDSLLDTNLPIAGGSSGCSERVVSTTTHLDTGTSSGFRYRAQAQSNGPNNDAPQSECIGRNTAKEMEEKEAKVQAKIKGSTLNKTSAISSSSRPVKDAAKDRPCLIGVAHKRKRGRPRQKMTEEERAAKRKHDNRRTAKESRRRKKLLVSKMQDQASALHLRNQELRLENTKLAQELKHLQAIKESEIRCTIPTPGTGMSATQGLVSLRHHQHQDQRQTLSTRGNLHSWYGQGDPVPVDERLGPMLESLFMRQEPTARSLPQFAANMNHPEYTTTKADILTALRLSTEGNCLSQSLGSARASPFELGDINTPVQGNRCVLSSDEQLRAGLDATYSTATGTASSQLWRLLLSNSPFSPSPPQPSAAPQQQNLLNNHSYPSSSLPENGYRPFPSMNFARGPL